MEGSDEFQPRPAGDLPGRQRPSAAPAPELGCHTGPDGWILPRTPPGIREMSDQATEPSVAKPTLPEPVDPDRRDFLAFGLSATVLAALPTRPTAAQSLPPPNPATGRAANMGTITTRDGVEIFYKDWGPRNAQPLAFHHGWPLSADDWDTQLLYFLDKGYRVVAHDRRGHGRSSQVSDGHDMDHYAADVAAVVEHLDLRNAVHIGHSTGGGEATHYVARHGQGQGRVAKLVLIGAVPPIMVKTPANPGGLPIEVFDGLRQRLAANRAQFYGRRGGGRPPSAGSGASGVRPSARSRR
jgi:non-heme chloroperoxidase